MPKLTPQFDPALYAPVADRLALFWTAFPSGRIATTLHARTDHEVIFVAYVYRGESDAHPAATGWASEREGDGDINTVACLENTETSAIGRALANLGFTAARARPSMEEMQKATRVRARVSRVSSPDGTRYESSTPHVSAGEQQQRQQHEVLQHRANVTLDMLRLIEAALRVGLRPPRADRWRQQLMRGRLTATRLQEWEARLREWTRRHS